MDDVMLTTIDNPYNPRTDYVKWMRWDKDNGYNTQEYLARLVVDSEFEDYQTVQASQELAIEFILENDTLEVYKLV